VSAAPSSTPAGNGPGLQSWIKLAADAVPLVSVAGLLSYAALRIAYLAFYLRLGTTPEEVGYGYSQILGGTLVGVVWLVVLVAPLFFLARWGVASVASLLLIARRLVLADQRVKRLARRAGARIWGPWIRRAIGSLSLGELRRRDLRQVFRRCVYLGALVVLVLLPYVAWVEGGLAARGLTVRQLSLSFGPPVISFLAVQAESAQVHWVGDRQGSGAFLDRLT
jgi:hypothetical protein